MQPESLRSLPLSCACSQRLVLFQNFYEAGQRGRIGLRWRTPSNTRAATERFRLQPSPGAPSGHRK